MLKDAREGQSSVPCRGGTLFPAVKHPTPHLQCAQWTAFMASPGRGLTLSSQVLGKNHRFRLALHSVDQENGECQLINGLLLGRSIEVTVEALFEVICSQKICNSGPAALSDCLCHGYLRRFSLKASFAAAAARVSHEHVAICLQLTKALPGSPPPTPHTAATTPWGKERSGGCWGDARL